MFYFTHRATISSPLLHLGVPVQALTHVAGDRQRHARCQSVVYESGVDVPSPGRLLKHLRGYHPAIAS